MPRAKKTTPATTAPILITFVLDRSGSMETCRQATIDGFNEFKNGQAKQPGETLFSLTTFNTDFTIEHPAKPIQEIPNLTMDTYEPDGMTALYDAIAHTIKNLEIKLTTLKPSKNLFVIMTDGEENSSREFNHTQIFALMETKKAAGWDFVYLGANQDAYVVGAQMGIPKGATMTYAATPIGTRTAFAAVASATTAYRVGGQSAGRDFFTHTPLLPIDPALRLPKSKPKTKHTRL